MTGHPYIAQALVLLVAFAINTPHEYLRNPRTRWLVVALAACVVGASLGATYLGRTIAGVGL